jgi:hypothetical protein
MAHAELGAPMHQRISNHAHGVRYGALNALHALPGSSKQEQMSHFWLNASAMTAVRALGAE